MNVYLAFKEKLLASTNSATSFWGLLTRLFLSTNLPQQTVEEIAAGSRPTTSHRRPCWSSICLTFFFHYFLQICFRSKTWRWRSQVHLLEKLGTSWIWEKFVSKLSDQSGRVKWSARRNAEETGCCLLFFFFFLRCLACSVLNVAIFVLTKTVTRMTRKTFGDFLTNIFLFYFASQFNLLNTVMSSSRVTQF